MKEEHEVKVVEEEEIIETDMSTQELLLTIEVPISSHSLTYNC